jgi:RNA polymerase sigma-70 factor (ECF subfamily)
VEVPLREDPTDRRASDPARPVGGPRPADARIAEDPSDGELVGRAVAGDRDAFDVLARRHAGRLVATARRLLRDLGEAEEAAADALVRAHAALGRLSCGDSFGPWVHRVAVRTALDRLRARRSTRGRQASLDDTGLDGAGGGAATRGHGGPTRGPADRAGDAETLERVRAAVDGLPETQRVALVLHAWEGLAYQDVAELLGCSYDAVRVAVAHGRRTLRRRLAHLAEDGS